MCHFNSTESIQSCSRLGALNLSYITHCHLCPTRYSFSPESSEAFEGEVPCPRTQHLNSVPRLRGEKHDISLKILHQVGFETARQAATSAERHALTIAPCPSLYISGKIKSCKSAYYFVSNAPDKIREKTNKQTNKPDQKHNLIDRGRFNMFPLWEPVTHADVNILLGAVMSTHLPTQ